MLRSTSPQTSDRTSAKGDTPQKVNRGSSKTLGASSIPQLQRAADGSNVVLQLQAVGATQNAPQPVPSGTAASETIQMAGGDNMGHDRGLGGDLLYRYNMRLPPVDIALLQTFGLTSSQAGALMAYGFSISDLLGYARAGQPTDIADLYRYRVPQAPTAGDVKLLIGLNRSGTDIATLANLGTAGLAEPPSFAMLQVLARLPKTVPEIVALAGEQNVTSSAQLINLSNSVTDEASMGSEWELVEDDFQMLIREWPHWSINALTDKIQLDWAAQSQVVRTSHRAGQATPADIQTFTIDKNRMTLKTAAIRALIPALTDGQRVLDQAGTLKTQVAATEANIAKLLIYHNAASTDRTTITTEQAKLATEKLRITSASDDTTADKTTFSTMQALTPAQAQVYAQSADTRKTTAADVASKLDAIDLALDPLSTDAAFVAASRHGNLKLTRTAAAHTFWASLTVPQQRNLNTKLAGYTPSAWTVAGYPGTRAKQNGYTGAQILIPTIAGFPLTIGGEIVHDWIFNTPDHGHPASKLLRDADWAINRQKYKSGPHFAFDPDPPNNGLYTWSNMRINIIIRGGTLITYYNPN
ncbi:hypothetical protein ACOTTU_17690 [Roseobacter sp. EG26]|uniref:hypothetical protein n=1 Tax=Roseobacter sp. EG26 TaxID=3412477 RepID=UPI003CE4E51C